jgi:hypothetical protein
MRPWFTFIVTLIVVVALLVFILVVNFVLDNQDMFKQTFNIKLTLPFPFAKWSHTWTEIQFISIIAGSLLLGALIIVITTLGLDTKRALKIRSMRKELKQLQEALQKAQASLETQKPIREEQPPAVEEEPVEIVDSSSATPEEITKSFEDTIQKSDFLDRTKQRHEEGQSDEGIETTEPGLDREAGEAHTGDFPLDKDKKDAHETPVEAEVVEIEERPDTKQTPNTQVT